jgi:hypothetical protein
MYFNLHEEVIRKKREEDLVLSTETINSIGLHRQIPNKQSRVEQEWQ